MSDSRSARTATTTTGHVLFTWHLPELWRRFTITLRRALRQRADTPQVPTRMRCGSGSSRSSNCRPGSYPHIHALIRLDPPDSDNCGGHDWQAPLTATELATIIQQAVRTVAVTANDSSSDTAAPVIRFGTQVDTQPIDNRHVGTDSRVAQEESPPGRMLPGRRVARYLAKYVTGSLADVGISAQTISTEAIADLDVSDHVRAILTTISQLADRGVVGCRSVAAHPRLPRPHHPQQIPPLLHHDAPRYGNAVPAGHGNSV